MKGCGLLFGMAALVTASGCCVFSSCPPPSKIPTPRAALDRMQELHSCSRALRGEARFDSFDEEGRVRAKTLFLMARPESVRFEVLSPLGTSMATLTADGKAFALLDQEQRQFFMGPANQCNVQRFLKVPIPPAALVQLFSGEAPILVHEPEQAQMAFEGGAYVIRIDSKHDAHQTIVLEPAPEDWNLPWQQQRLRVTEVAVEQKGVELYRASLKEHQPAKMAESRRDPDGLMPEVPPSGPVCRAELPRRVRFVVPVADRDVVFEHQKVQHNPPLSQGAFRQPIPEGVTIRPSDCE